MSRSWNKHHKNYYFDTTGFKKDYPAKRRAQKKFLLERMKKVSDEEKEDVEPASEMRIRKGEDVWKYD